MKEYTEKIRETAKSLLKEGKVDIFIGYRKGTVPMMNEPFAVSDPDKTDLLYWDSNCGMNLCNYLTKRTDRIGIIANGCNSRNIVTHIIENQIKREQLYILGIPCTGMIDPRAVRRAVKYREITDVEESNGRVIVKGDGFEETFEKKDVLQKNCAECLHRNPVIYDELVAEKVPEQEGIETFRDVKKIEAMGSDERWGFFTRMISSCIRCYACRNACPLCYCTTCFVDEAQPQWVGKSNDPTDTMTFHILRAFHCAGRCTDCGACERACPMGINVRQFTKKLNKDALELFSWEAGMREDRRPPMDVYKVDDYNDFIR
ncbi:MAG: 4Fe-4S dicluster domain-containing protein [Deltaproteobacteria bacterium]|nr:4Fe-4S dicluster domain-containing protein [Deltaproteobacteria bacterium]